MGISDLIAGFIQQELDEAGGALELQRSDLAQRFNCVPSQINYVMSTRFSPEHGYIVESRRGGGGYIRITRVQVDRQTLLMHVINSVGDTLDVYVISFDPEKHKISLGVKDRSMNPWDKFMATYHVGDVANVRIVKLMTFGAFAEILPGVDGLIHISQIADRRIEKPGDVLSEGQMVDAKITAVDEEKQKISLSIRALLADEPAEDEE